MSGKFFQSGLGKTIKWAVIGAVGLLLLAILLLDVFKVGSVALPPVVAVQLQPLEQGWSPGWEVGESQWFHHADQGTKILNYDWFMALDQPELTVLTKPGKFSDPEYLQRFGFIPSSADEEMNPHGLPVGFAVNRNFQEPQADAPSPYPTVGLTCAACHTGQINYQGKGLRIEGGSAMIDLGTFKVALGRALFYTKLFPWRFDRFARSALGDRYDADTKARLREEVEEFIAKGRREKEFADSKGLYALEGGVGRTDALALILNRLFDQVNQENQNVADAPVNFPHVWDTSWFEWVQYNASIRTPMVRNIGEVLGVGGMVNLPGTPGKNWESTVNVYNLHWMEKQLSGDEPYGGLTSPEWPAEVLGPLDTDLVEQGAKLYEKNCQGCHWRVEDIQAALADPRGQGGPNRAQMWTSENRYGKRFIKNSETIFNVEHIGTDPATAVNFARRVVVTTNGREVAVAGGKLDYVTSRVRQVEYEKLGFVNEFGETIEAQKDLLLAYDAYRLPFEEFMREKVAADLPAGQAEERTNLMIEAELNNQRDAVVRLAYKSRPLNGVWATAPYLHNGSVRNLYQLLSPVAERDVYFHLGSKEFDPVNVGYVNERLTGGFVMDTILSGNRNTGHEFRDTKPEEGKIVKGVIGPALTHDERMALVEYFEVVVSRKRSNIVLPNLHGDGKTPLIARIRRA